MGSTTTTPGGKRIILVVDDDPAISNLVQDALTDEGYAVRTALGAEAVRVAQEDQPHFILLDIMMPGMDGVEMSAQLRSDPRTAHIPIVVMSAFTPNTAPVGLQCDGWLAKPFSLTQLYATIGRWTAATRRG